MRIICPNTNSRYNKCKYFADNLEQPTKLFVGWLRNKSPSYLPGWQTLPQNVYFELEFRWAGTGLKDIQTGEVYLTGDRLGQVLDLIQSSHIVFNENKTYKWVFTLYHTWYDYFIVPVNPKEFELLMNQVSNHEDINEFDHDDCAAS